MTEHLPVPHPWAWSLAACILAAALEGVLSGTKVRLRFAELKLPQPVLPLWAWSIIGLAYYVLLFLVLDSLLSSPPTPRWTQTALALIAFVLAANAGWSWVFFRKKDLWLSVVFFVPYVLLALALALALFRVGSQLAPWFLLYVGYLAYATWWGYSVWRLNRLTPDAG
jgi:tryptophan-rich sensory protein